MKRTAVLVLALLAVTAHAQRSSSRSSDESPRSSRGSRKFDSLSAREELGASTQDWEAVTPAARAPASRRAAAASRGQPQSQQAPSRRRPVSTAPRSRTDPLQSLEAEQVAASSVIAPVVTQQFVSRRPASDKPRSAPSRRREADAAPASAAPSRRRPQTASGDSDAAAAALEPTTYSRRRPTPASSGDQEAPSTRRRPSTASLPTAAPAPVFEAPEEPSTSSTTTTTTTTTAAPVPETPPAPERVVPARFDSSRRRNGGSSSSSSGVVEPEATLAPRQRGGGRRAGGGSARRGGGGVSSQDSEAAPTPTSTRERTRGGRREQQPAAAVASRATASRGRGPTRTAATSTTTTTTTTTSTTTAAPLPTNPDTEVAPDLNAGDEDSNAVQQQPDAAAAESTAQAQELPQLPASTEASQAAGNPRPDASRRKAADDGGAARQAAAPRRGSVRSRGGASAGDDGRSATAVASSRRSGSRSRNSIGQPAPADEVLPTGAGAPATFARTSSRRASPRSRPTAVDLTTADTSQNDVQPRSSIRGRSHVDSVPNGSSSGRRSNRRGSATPDVDASGNSAGGASVQRTSRKINPDTNARPSFKNTRRGTSSKKLTTEATSIKDEIDESENYPPEFIQKIKSSVDTKDVKTTQSSLLTSSSEDTFITKSSDKVVSVLTPSLPEDYTNAADDKENQNNDVVQDKLETRRRSNKYTGRARSYKTGSNEVGKQRKVDLLLAPSPPSEREVTTPTVRSSPQSQYKSSSGYSLRGTKKDTASEDTNKVETPSPATPDTLQLDSPITSPTQSTRTAFRTKSNLRNHHTSKLEKENIVTAPGGSFTQNSQDPSTRPSFRRAFPTRSRSAAYKSHSPRNEQPSASTEDNIISSRSYTPRPNSGKTRTTSSFRRSIAATTDDIQNEIQTSAQPPATPRSLVGTPRFSARFRNDLLLATGGLRSTTTTPAYIPTVPLIRAASTTTTETSAENPSEGLTLDKSSLTMTGDNLLDDSFQGRLKLDNDVSFHLDNSTEMNHVDEETVTYSASSSSAPVTKMTSLSPASDYNNENSQEATITTTAATSTTEITNSVLTTLNPKIVVPNNPLSQTTSSIISDLSHSPLNESSETPVMTETVSEVPEIRSTTFLTTSTNTRLPSSTQKKKLPLRKEFAIALLKIVSRVNRPTVPVYVTTVTSNLNEETTVPYSPPTTTAAEMISELSQQDITTFSPHVTLQAKKITTRAVTYSPEVVSSATVGTTPQSSTEEVKATSIKSTTEKMPEVTSEVVRSTSTSPKLSSSLLSLSPDVVNSTAATSNSAVPLTETTLSEIVTVASTTETLISTVSEIKPPTSTKAVNILAVDNPQADFTENITNEIKTSSSNNVVHTSNSSAPEVLKIRNSEIRFVSVDRPPLESDNLVTESSHDFSTSVKGPVLLGQSTTTYSSTEQVSASSTVQIPSASTTLNNSSQSTSAEMLKMINTTRRAVSVDKGPPNNHTLASIQPINLTPSASLNASTISMSITEPSKLITESVTQSLLSSTETDSLASTRFPVRITIAPRGTASTTRVPPLVERQVSNDPVAQRRLVDDINDENKYFASSSNYRTTTTVRTPLPFVIFGIFPNNTVFRKYPHSGKTEQVSENEIARHQEYYPEEQTSQTSSTSVTGDPIANEILYRNTLRNSVQTSLPHATVNTRLPAGRNPSENDVAWALGTRTSIPIPPAQSEIDSGQQTEMINDSKKITPGSEAIVASASDRSLIPTVTQRIQPPVTFAFPSEVSNSVYNVQGSKYSNYWSSSTTEKPKFHYITSNYISAEIPTSTSIPLYIVTPEPATSSTTKVIYKWKPVIDKQNLVEKTVDNGISSTTENLNTATQLPISTNTQTVPSTSVSSTEATLPLSSSTMTISQTTAKIVAGVTTPETVSSVPSGISNSQEITTPVISLSEPTGKLSTVGRIDSTLSSSVPIINEKVTVTASVTTERVLSQSATSPPPPLSIRGLISRVLGNITPSITTASTASPVMTVTAKRQLTAMTSLPVSSYITERLVTVTPMVPLTNNSSSEPALTPKPATSLPTTTKAVSAIESTVQATTTEAITVKPTTLKSTMTIATSLKTTTTEPTTLKPTTSKPSTPKPTTPKPTTVKPTTSKPTTPKTMTPKPTTSKPTTPKPTPAKSTKSIPTTPKPVTSKPTTPKPTTSKPNTSKPTTSISTTPKPTTSKPTAPKPTTSKATTPKPTTPKPTTPKPTTPKPTTPKPTTAKPTTPKPTTPKPTTPKPTTPKPTTPKATTSQPVTPKPSTSKPTQVTSPPQPLITSPRNSFTYSSLNTLESDIKHVESESVDERNSWQTLDRQGSLEELSLLNILAQNVGGRQEQKKTNLADKVIEAALQRSSTTTSPLFNNNVPKTKVVQTLENGVESNRFSLDLLGQQSRNINADDVTDAPAVTASILELDTSKSTPVVSSKSPTVETVTSGKLSPQDEQLLLALFGNQISAAVQQPKSQNTRSRSRLSPEEQLLAALLRQQATADLKTASKGSQQQKEQIPEGLSLSTTSPRPKSQRLPVPGKISEEELLLSLLGGQPKTTQKATEQVNSTRPKLSDEEILAALLSGQSKGATRTVATTQRVSTKPRRLLTDEQIIAGLLAGSTPASPADQSRLNELLNGGRHKTRMTTTTPAVPRGLGFLLARPGSQGLFSSALQPDAGSLDPGVDLGEDGIRGPREQGTLVKAAIDVTKAVSQFMSAVIQGATRSFQSFFRSGTSLLSQYFSLGSAQAGNFQLR